MKKIFALGILVVMVLSGCFLFYPSVPKLPVFWKSSLNMSKEINSKIISIDSTIKEAEVSALSIAPIITGFTGNTISASVGSKLTTNVLGSEITTDIAVTSKNELIFTSVFTDGVSGSVIAMSPKGDTFNFTQTALYGFPNDVQYVINSSISDAVVTGDNYTANVLTKGYFYSSTFAVLTLIESSVKSVNGWMGIYVTRQKIATITPVAPDSTALSSYSTMVDNMGIGTELTGLPRLYYYDPITGVWAMAPDVSTAQSIWNAH
jgi:hypothetical protein